MPSVPRPPRYDGRLGRKGGFVWLSELSLESLEWWHAKKLESASSDSQYAEKDGKTAATLAKWIEWRRLFPNERWYGTRGEEKVTAEAPSREPQVNAWEEKANGAGGKKPTGTPRGNAAPPRDDDDYSF